MKLIESTPDSGGSIPQINLCNGRTISALSLGTFKSDLYMAEQIAGALDFAIRGWLSSYQLCLGLHDCRKITGPSSGSVHPFTRMRCDYSV